MERVSDEHLEAIVKGNRRNPADWWPMAHELIALRKFKAYVHQRLDEAGVPVDIVLAKVALADAARREVEEMEDSSCGFSQKEPGDA